MITHLIDALNSSDLVQALSAIEALAASGDSKAVAPLVRALSSADPQRKRAICHALGELGDLRATTPLLSQLRDTSDDVRNAAFAALYLIGQKNANSMPDASAWETHFEDPNVALTQIAWQTDLEAVKVLQSSLEDSDSEVRSAAIYTLGQLGILGALQSISQCLYQDPDDEVRSAAAYALGQMAQQGSSETLNFVTQAFQWVWSHPDTSVNVQTHVIRALSELEHLGAAPTFLQAISHPDHVLRQLAVIGLGRLRAPDALAPLKGALQDSSTGVRRNAAYAIGFLGAAGSIETLIYGAVDQSSEVRSAIGASLANADRSVVLEQLAHALSDERYEIRVAVAYLLGYVIDETGLKAALSDPHPDVRRHATLSIGSAVVRPLRTAVQQRLTDPEWKVRAAAAEALKRLKDPASIKALQVASSDEHPVVRNVVEVALASFQPQLPI